MFVARVARRKRQANPDKTLAKVKELKAKKAAMESKKS